MLLHNKCDFSYTFLVLQSSETQWLLVAAGRSKCKTEIKTPRFLPCLLDPTLINYPLVSEDVAFLDFIKFFFVSVVMSHLRILNFSSHSLQTIPVYLVEQDIAV